MTKTNKQTLNELFKEYGLVYDADDKKNSDVFKTKNFTIITRSGIEKIQAALDIKVKYEVQYIDPFFVAMKGIFGYTNKESGEVIEIETFGEASVDRKEIAIEEQTIEKDGARKSTKEAVEIITVKGNIQQQPAYPLAMAEKRALSRGVLKIAGLYEHGVFGEDEADAFKRELDKERFS